MLEYTNQTLGVLIEKLDEKIVNGFKGVHERQDKTNGNVMSNSKKISKLENWRWYLVGGGSVVLFGFTIVLKYV